MVAFKRRTVFALACAVVFASVYRFHKLLARYSNVDSEQKFEQLIDRNDLTVALFYQGTGIDREERRQNRIVKKIVDDLSERIFYKDAGVKFATIDVTQSAAQNLQIRYQLRTLPVILLFENGKVVKNKSGLPVVTQPFDKNSIQDVIEDYFGDRIDEIRRRKRDLREQQEERNRSRRTTTRSYSYVVPSYSGYGYYPGYYNNWYGYPGWYGGPSWSFGIGFGGGGYRRGYGRGYYGGRRGGWRR